MKTIDKINKKIAKYLGWILYPASKQGKEEKNKKWNR